MKLSLTHHLIRCEREHGIDSDLRLLLETVARACKTISHAVGKGALGNVLGSASTTNIQGEAQKKLDGLNAEIAKRREARAKVAQGTPEYAAADKLVQDIKPEIAKATAAVEAAKAKIKK